MINECKSIGLWHIGLNLYTFSAPKDETCRSKDTEKY